MNRLLFTVSFSFLLYFSPATVTLANSLEAGECKSQYLGGQPIRWCLHRGSPLSEHVVYYFHGIGSTEEKWENSRIRSAVEEKVSRAPHLKPHVISISFGRAWFLTDVKKEGRKSRLKVLRRALPHLEAQLKAPIARRSLVGESMGGYNVLRLAIAEPESFQQVVALCPALLPVGPYSSDEEKEAFIERNRRYLNVRLLETLRYWAVREFPTQEDWTRNNPLDLADHPIPQLPPIYLSQNVQDHYGFPEGTTAFAAKLTAQGHSVTLRTEDSGHCRHTEGLLKEAANTLLMPAELSVGAL